MSSDYDVRVETPFTVGALHDASEQVLQRIIPGAPPVALDVRLWTQGLREEFAEAPRATAEFLARVHGGRSPLVPDYLVMTPDAEGVAGVSEIDIGYADDPEGGRRLGVTSHFQRMPPSYLLGIVVATAAAILTGGPVVDEYSQLTGDRLADPEGIIARLRNPDAHGTLSEMAAATLTTAGLPT